MLFVYTYDIPHHTFHPQKIALMLYFALAASGNEGQLQVALLSLLLLFLYVAGSKRGSRTTNGENVARNRHGAGGQDSQNVHNTLQKPIADV